MSDDMLVTPAARVSSSVVGRGWHWLGGIAGAWHGRRWWHAEEP